MPFKPKVPCRQPGCPELVESGKLYCAKHLPLHPEVTRPASKRGYGSAYLYADMEHLKECALGLDKYPLAEEVISLV